MRMLIVDDEEMNREVLRELLEANGYQVHEATDGAEAFERARSDVPNLILMDIRMPKVDGFDTFAKLRSDPDTARIPVIAVTAFAMESDRLRTLSAGFDAYISKPVDFQLLLKTIHQLLDRKN